jgi:hypothetical protein
MDKSTNVSKKKCILNSAKCSKCGDILISIKQGQMIVCQCGNLSIDGGLDFRHRKYVDNMMLWEELSQFEE